MRLINAVKTVTYDCIEIAGYIAESEMIPVEEVTFQQVMEWINDYVAEDFTTPRDVIFLNEDGQEVGDYDYDSL